MSIRITFMLLPKQRFGFFCLDFKYTQKYHRCGGESVNGIIYKFKTPAKG